MGRHKEMILRNFLFIELLLITFLFIFSNIAFGQIFVSKPVFDFKGRYLVSVSDADMVASAYLNGYLGDIEGKDALSIIRLDKPVNALKAVAIEVSNSVTGPPSSVTVSPDGRYAIVIETRGQRPTYKPNALLGDLPPGKIITVIDLFDPDHPKITQQIDGAEHPLSVTFNIDGSLVAITYSSKNTGQRPLVIYQFAMGKLANLSIPNIPDYNDGDVLNGVVFHPIGNVLVLLNATKSILSFFKITQSDSGISLLKWGNPVLVDKEPFKACFTPNGRFLVVNAMYPGSVRGSVTSIGIAIENSNDGTPIHQIVSRVLAGVLPEGLAISPNAQWIVTTNLEQSTQPFDNPKQGFFSSLTLIRLNAETGLLERIGDFAFDGILPESVVFDNTSRFIAVATFDHYDVKKAGGSIDFWRLTSDYFDLTRVELVKTDYSIPVTRGVHSMVIVR
ncbi:MAG: hypothetical protein H7X99_03975 [Saprospiraceae bacterium]|nr:hypothetical protein [Saprospiraceae bacterium]